ncbi:MAG TPA: response regulator [Opitutaceae bacterium]|nr:response regulator [Opitutaceae bacterium]
MHTLHLEDSPEDGELVHALLRSEWPECQITRVESREQFEAAIGSVRFDLILSDNSLPGFDGRAALDEAIQVCPDTPFIFLSGTLGEERAIEALRQGAADYVVKDRPARLVPAIRQAFHRRRVELELRNHRERFRQIAESVTDMIKVLDLNGCCLYYNPAYRAILGEGYAAKHGNDAFAEIHPDDRDRVRRAFNEVVGSGRPQEAVYRLVMPTGAIRHIEALASVIRDASGMVTNVLVVARDVTARREAEVRLREQAALLDKADDAILVRALDGEKVTYWNKGAERLYGWTAEEMAAPGAYSQIVRAGDQTQKAQKALMAEGEWTGELRHVTKAGKEVRVHSRWTLLRDPQGQPTGILSLSRDITEQKELETQLLRSQRLESIGMLAGGIAHDLNNVLAPILMSVNLLQEKVPDPEAQRMLKILDSSAHRGADLVRQILAFARGSVGERAELRPKLVIRDVAQLLAETLPRSVKIETDYATDLWLISGNSTELGQVVMNLCVNARDAMPGGGTLAVRAHNLQVDEALARANGAQPGPYVAISVADTGSGIPPEIIERIFDPFFTTKAAGKGTGLGLSTVLGIVRSHGGFLQVQSEVGRGTEFRLFFPAVEASAAPEVKAEAALPRGRGETVLLIEDEEGVRKIVRALLESRGYKVIAASDGATGVALYRDHRAEVDVVLTDMMMPGLQGKQVVASLREINPVVKIVVMSGVLGDSDGLEEQPGQLTFLQKPMTADQLLKAFRRVLPERPQP